MGIPLISQIVKTGSGEYALVDQGDIRGSYRSVNSTTDMNNIITDDRSSGMLVFVINENTFFQLASDLITWNELTLDKSFTFTQPMSATIWTINHNLGKNPSVSVVDYSNNNIEGLVCYVDLNNLTITFNPGVSGYAYLN